MESGEKIRAFIAIYPPPEVLHQLNQWLQKLHLDLHGDGIRWARNEQLHLTLQFLGYVATEQIQGIQNSLRPIVSSHPQFRIKAGSLGCFPSISRPRVLWVGLAGQLRELQKLKLELDEVLIPFGYKPEAREFHPHLTLARLSNISAGNRTVLEKLIEENANFSAGEFVVQKIELMQSFLSSKGARHGSLGSYFLQNSQNSLES